MEGINKPKGVRPEVGTAPMAPRRVEQTPTTATSNAEVNGGSDAEKIAKDIEKAEAELLTHLDNYDDIQKRYFEKDMLQRDKWDGIVEKHQRYYEEAIKNINAITLAAGGASLYGSISAFAYAVGNMSIDSSAVRDGLTYGSAGFCLAFAIGVLGVGSRGVAEGINKLNQWRDERGSDKESDEIFNGRNEQTLAHNNRTDELQYKLNNLRNNSN
jgi:hypothetical protein